MDLYTISQIIMKMTLVIEEPRYELSICKSWAILEIAKSIRIIFVIIQNFQSGKNRVLSDMNEAINAH